MLEFGELVRRGRTPPRTPCASRVMPLLLHRLGIVIPLLLPLLLHGPVGRNSRRKLELISVLELAILLRLVFIGLVIFLVRIRRSALRTRMKNGLLMRVLRLRALPLSHILVDLDVLEYPPRLRSTEWRRERERILVLFAFLR